MVDDSEADDKIIAVPESYFERLYSPETMVR